MSETRDAVDAREETSEVMGGAVVGVFKKCTLCGKVWNKRSEFLGDPGLRLNGYQGSLRRLLAGRQRRGLLLFTHQIEGCGTTMAVDPADFRDERHEKIPDNSL
jgi:hypothetical protein